MNQILVLKNTEESVIRTFFTDEVVRKLNELGNVEYYRMQSRNDMEELRSKIRNVDVLFTGWGVPDFDDAFYDAAANLKMIAHTGGSIGDLVNDAYKKHPGIRIISGNKIYAQSVAEATICYMLIGQRKLYKTIRETERMGWWSKEYTEGLRGKTVGLVGLGMISKNVAKMLRPFLCGKILVSSSHEISEEEKAEYGIETCSMEELFSACDIVSVHTGLTPKTVHSIDRHLLSLMKPNALLVNTARGAIIDQHALEETVQQGKIRAVLDVFEQEPLPPDSKLRNLDNVVIIPHRAGPTTDLRSIVVMELIKDVKALFEGATTFENEISADYGKNMTRRMIFRA